MEPRHPIRPPGPGGSLLESSSTQRGSTPRKAWARPGHRAVLYDLFYRRGGALCLYYGFERLRTIASACPNWNVHYGSVGDMRLTVIWLSIVRFAPSGDISRHP